MAAFRVCFLTIIPDQPFQFCPPPLLSSLQFDKARPRNLPGNLHIIKATASAYHTTMEFDDLTIVSGGAEGIGDSIILIICTIFRSIYVVYPIWRRKSIATGGKRDIQSTPIQSVLKCNAISFRSDSESTV